MKITFRSVPGHKNDMPLAKDTKVDERYRIIRPLGMGGFGVVYEAHQDVIDRKVALKFLECAGEFSQESIIRFEREGRALSLLQHRNIVTLYGFGAHLNQPYIAMEYIEGPTLQQLVTREEKLPGAQAVALISQVLEALQCAHANGIVHRDLKPTNIIISADNEGKPLAKVVDFGLVKLLTSEEQKLTLPASVLGTPLFMSPEQAQGDPVDARSDVYAAACLLYYCLVGTPLFQADEQVAIMAKHIYEAPDLDRPEISEDLARVLQTALQKDPAARYQSAADMITVLRSCRYTSRGSSTLPRRMAGAARKFADKRVIAACVVLGIGITAFAVMAFQPPSKRSEQPAVSHHDRVATAELARNAYDNLDEYRAQGHAPMTSPRTLKLIADCNALVDAYGKTSEDPLGDIVSLLSRVSEKGEDLIAIEVYRRAEAQGIVTPAILEDRGLMRVCSALTSLSKTPAEATKYLPLLKTHVERAFSGDTKQMFVSIPAYITELNRQKRFSEAVEVARKYYDLEHRIHGNSYITARAGLLLNDSLAASGKPADPAVDAAITKIAKAQMVEGTGDLHSAIIIYCELGVPTRTMPNKDAVRRDLLAAIESSNPEFAAQLRNGTFNPLK